MHSNVPLSHEGRRRLIQRCRNRPIAHVAAEMGISRACASKWFNRWRRHGEAGLRDQPSVPYRSPAATPAWVIEAVVTVIAVAAAILVAVRVATRTSTRRESPTALDAVDA